MKLKKQLQKLERIASSLGFGVIYSNETNCSATDKVISVNANYTLRNKIYALAHEIGHAETLPDCQAAFGRLTPSGCDRSWSTREAEFCAWLAADLFANDLNFYDKYYLQFKHAHLASYYQKD